MPTSGHPEPDTAPPPVATLLSQLLAQLGAEFPEFRIVRKKHDRFSRLLDVLLRVVTLNRMHTFMTHYHTVIGDTLYVPESWDRMSAVDKVILLRHERVHLIQRRRLTLVGMALVYLVPILPLGLAYGRARLEWEAYAETLRATWELLGPEAARSPSLRAHIVARFCNADYGWMWPFPSQVNRWYDRVLDEFRC